MCYYLGMKTIKEIRKQTGLNQSQFAEKFHLKLRTVRAWEQGQRNTPDYVMYMIQRILELENKSEK